MKAHFFPAGHKESAEENVREKIETEKNLRKILMPATSACVYFVITEEWRMEPDLPIIAVSCR